MKTLYIKQDGKKVNTEVSDELYEEMKQMHREEWRNDFNFRYKFYSLDERMEQGCDIADDSLNPETILICQEDEKQKPLQYKKLKKALKTLTEKQRDALYMHFLYDMPYSEIASDSNVSKQAIAQSIHSGLKKLRKLF